MTENKTNFGKKLLQRVLLISVILSSIFSCKKEEGNTPQSEQITIGNTYQGGIIFYIDGTGEHGLIAAPEDQSTSSIWTNIPNIRTNANGITVGTGTQNTTTIISAQGSGTYAATVCYLLSLNGYDDWFLPSKNELSLLYQQKEAVGGFSTDYYWSSSEYDTLKAWRMYFPFGNENIISKDSTAGVRAIRAF